MKKNIIFVILVLIAAFLFFSLLNTRENKENQPKTGEVMLYYYDQEKDKDSQGNVRCSRDGLTALKRSIPESSKIIEDTIRLLIKGELTQQERAMGISTEYPLEGVTLEAVELQNGLLTLTFNDPNFRTSGGSCRVGILWFQIDETAKQFSEVKEVRFLPEELFQP